jgi:hypothetical protein
MRVNVGGSALLSVTFLLLSYSEYKNYSGIFYLKEMKETTVSTLI